MYKRQELGRLYATEPALYDGEYNPNCFEWIACESRDEGVYAWPVSYTHLDVYKRQI